MQSYKLKLGYKMKLSKCLGLIALVGVLLSCGTKNKNEIIKKVSKMEERKLTVEVFKGEAATVNSYLFSNGKSLAVMDVLRSSENALELVQLIKSKELPLEYIVISHGHPDHFTGMAVLKKEFPMAKIYVGSEEVKQDIIGFSNWMESVGWWEKEPNLKPKSEKNPNGFDYENQINVLQSNTITLNGGGTLEIETLKNATEAGHISMFFSKDLNAFFSSDLCYNGVHLWFGAGVEKEHIQQWEIELKKLKERYGNRDITVYPGHGDKSTTKLFDVDLKYISDFKSAIENSTTKEQVIQKMKELYPTWKQEDFLLPLSAEYQMSIKDKN
jgi:glyoxylase-like metal-dependent hydrolase (beta-lactamase superfamily II)